tara:strand:- start:13067 stop:14083 length:1017 start_codon:yes stop_codon:yes gene_type:complete
MKLSSNWVSFEDFIELLEENVFQDKSLFHSESWLMAISKGFNADLKPIKTCDASGNVIALTPYVLKKKGPFKLFGAPLRGLYTEFTGSLFIENTKEDIKLLVLESQSRFLQKAADYIEFGFENGKDSNVQKVFENMQYNVSTRSSSIINLDVSQDELLKSYTGRARNMIRKSEKLNICVSKVSPYKEWIDHYYSILNDTFIRQGAACPHPLSFFYKLKDLHASGNILFLEATKEGEFVAGSIFLLDRSRMVYFSGASNLEGMKSAATSALQWHAMMFGINNNFKKYDMGGLGIPSIDKFKFSFGGEQYWQDRWIYKSKLFSICEPIAEWAVKKGILRF